MKIDELKALEKEAREEWTTVVDEIARPGLHQYELKALLDRERVLYERQCALRDEIKTLYGVEEGKI